MSRPKIKRKKLRIRFSPHIEKRVEVPRPAHDGVVLVDAVEYGVTVREGGVVLTARSATGHRSSALSPTSTTDNDACSSTGTSQNQELEHPPVAVIMDSAQAKAVGLYLIEAAKASIFASSKRRR